jgi:hypothetical protein
MTATLPKIGRPSVSGLSIKLLGPTEYRRRFNELKYGKRPYKRRWTGLSRKLLGDALYARAWRKMRIIKQSQIQSADISKSQTNDP